MELGISPSHTPTPFFLVPHTDPECFLWTLYRGKQLTVLHGNENEKTVFAHPFGQGYMTTYEYKLELLYEQLRLC